MIDGLFALLRFVVSLLLAVVGIYLSVLIFDWLTRDIEEVKEIKKGNVAVAIFMATLVIAVALVLRVGILELVAGLQSSYPLNLLVFVLAINLVKLAVGLVLTVFAFFVAFSVLDALTQDINELAELKKGNVAMAILISGVLIAVALVIDVALADFFTAFNACSLVSQFGLGLCPL